LVENFNLFENNIITMEVAKVVKYFVGNYIVGYWCQLLAFKAKEELWKLK
jgi:hypothetical protein